MNNINNLNNRRLGKLLVGASLSLTIAISAGTLFSNSHSAYAAAASTISSNSTVSVADKVISTGKQFLGVPYQFGAKANQTSTFDCSSFTQYVFKQAGITLPRSSKQQASSGTYVPRNQLQPGDLVFSDTNKDGVINHVSIYIGDGKLLHTYRVGIGVTISNFAGSAWDRTYVTARRVIPSNGNTVVVTPPTNATNPSTDNSNIVTNPSTDNGNNVTNPSTDNGNTVTNPSTDNGNIVTNPSTDNSTNVSKPSKDNGTNHKKKTHHHKTAKYHNSMEWYLR
ncbi:hypothetical protein D7Z26_00520 [Cohnella endophytica]|uniref:NlpC/P60 domain-containing protein n=1 Tax=Cohnella endophytica TaxID=2419778 RepID=A0A494Y5S3_9BACL|nr:C40 family peptidase [Cohnella endophytica]RKP58030.1 hypothetical protein D7Z26_00520 [Cohnella endophytica]